MYRRSPYATLHVLYCTITELKSQYVLCQYLNLLSEVGHSEFTATELSHPHLHVTLAIASSSQQHHQCLSWNCGSSFHRILIPFLFRSL